MPPVMKPETISSTQSLTERRALSRRGSPRGARLFPCGFGDGELRGRAIGRPYDLEVAADPLTDRAGELDLRALESDRADDRRVLAGRDVFADRLAVHADLLDGRLEDLEPRPAVGAGPAIGLLLEALHVGVEVRLRGGARLGSPRPATAAALGVGAPDPLVKAERRAHHGGENLRVGAHSPPPAGGGKWV